MSRPRTLLLMAVAAFAGLCASGCARAESQVSRAIVLFQNGNDKAAARLLHEAVADEPDLPAMALAHIYLGLVALDALRTADAAAEFRRAIQLDPTVELPYLASPKAEIVFRDVRRKILANGMVPTSPPTASGAPPQSVAPPPSIVVVEAPASATPIAQTEATSASASKLPGILVLCAAAGAVVVGLVEGSLSDSDANNAKAPGAYSTAENLAKRSATEGATADVLFAVGGAAAIAGGILLALEFKQTNQVSVSVTPSGGAVGLAGTF